MRIAKNDVPERMNVPGAVVRQAMDFGDASGYGTITAEYFSLGAGTDIAPLLKGLEGDLCQSPHWGFVPEGEITVTYSDGKEEIVRGGEMFYWPPGHTVSVQQDAELLMFSPERPHLDVLAHMKAKIGG